MEQVTRIGRQNNSCAELLSHYNPNLLNDEFGGIELHSLLREYDNDFIGVRPDKFLDLSRKVLLIRAKSVAGIDCALEE